jgi:hypothetical protein
MLISPTLPRRLAGLIACAALAPSIALAQALPAAPADVPVTALLAPPVPLPSEASTAGITKFSFIAYGDTRGRHDGEDGQSEHTLVVESMLATIKRAATTTDPIRFVLQSGDAVVNGSMGAQWNVSYAPLINRLTQEGKVPYFLSVGNHDVGSSTNLADPRRVSGLRNYLAANAALIPRDGSLRRLSGYPTYAFGFGNSFFIAFDSAIPDDSTQYAWVKDQLERLDRKRYVNVALFFHHPAFSSGPHGGARLETQAASIRSRWMPLFRRHHVRLLLTGHEHLFEHWVERYGDATGRHRIDQVVTGGGGAPLYGYVGEPDVRDYLRADTTAKIALEHLVKPAMEPGANPFHYVIVRVDGSRMAIEVVGVDWGRGFAPYRSSSASMTDAAP